MSAHEALTTAIVRKAHADEVPRLLTAQEVADLLRVPRSTIYELARTRRIPFVKVGRRTLFVPQALRDWLATASVKPDGDAGRTRGASGTRAQVSSTAATS